MTITTERLKELVNYNPETGIFTSLKTRGPAKAGKVLGTVRPDGYVQIFIGSGVPVRAAKAVALPYPLPLRLPGKWYKAHRLAWLYVYHEWPDGQIDHINGSKSDNRICNLRLATASQQNMNKPLRSDNASGTKGVYWHKAANKWASEIYLDGLKINLGYHDTLNDAAKARAEAAVDLFGEFVNTHHP